MYLGTSIYINQCISKISQILQTCCCEILWWDRLFCVYNRFTLISRPVKANGWSSNTVINHSLGKYFMVFLNAAWSVNPPGPGFWTFSHIVIFSQKTIWISSNFYAYVALWDPECTQFECYLGPSLHDSRTLLHFNVVLTVFDIDHISQGVFGLC